jgi:hypothetical protein
MANTEVSAMVRGAVKKGDGDTRGDGEGGVGQMAAAVSEPITGVRQIDIGRVLKGDRALIRMGDQEDRGVEGRYAWASGNRGETG